MSSRTLILIIILTIVTAGLVYIAITPKQEQPTPTPIVVKPTPTPAAQTTLAFDPNPLTVSSTSGSLNVIIDTKGNSATGVQLELAYDPLVLTNVTIGDPKTNPFFAKPLTLLKQINTKEGRITYALGIAPASPAVKGTGTVATITFRFVKRVQQTTTIRVLPATIVSAEGISASVLAKAEPATITLTTPTPRQ